MEGILFGIFLMLGGSGLYTYVARMAMQQKAKADNDVRGGSEGLPRKVSPRNLEGGNRKG